MWKYLAGIGLYLVSGEFDRLIEITELFVDPCNAQGRGQFRQVELLARLVFVSGCQSLIQPNLSTRFLEVLDPPRKAAKRTGHSRRDFAFGFASLFRCSCSLVPSIDSLGALISKQLLQL